MDARLHARPHPRRNPRPGVLAVFLAAWLGLLVAPCAPAAPLPAPQQHCDHMGTAGDGHDHHGTPCAEMAAADCAIPQDASSDGARPTPPARGTVLLILPAADARPGAWRAGARPGDRAATGPPLSIRYCTLLN